MSVEGIIAVAIVVACFAILAFTRLATYLVLLGGVVSGQLARWIRLPRVTGQIIAGVILGPSVFAVVELSAIHELRPVTSFALGLIAVRMGDDLYDEPLSWLHANPWTLGIGYGFGGTLLLLGLISLVPAFVTLQSGRVVRTLVEHTWLGKPAMPPADPRELVRIVCARRGGERHHVTFVPGARHQ